MPCFSKTYTGWPMAMSQKALSMVHVHCPWGTEVLLHTHAFPKGFVMFAQRTLFFHYYCDNPCDRCSSKTSSQTRQSATIKAEQAVSLLSCTVALESWENCLQSLALCKRWCGYTSPFSHESEIFHRALRPLRSFYIKPVRWEDLHIIKSVRNAICHYCRHH